MILHLPVLALALALSGAQESADVSFQLLDGWAIVTEATLGGVSHQKVLIDTGAVPSAINVRLAKRLGLSGSSQRISALNRPVDAERVHVTNVRVGLASADALDMTAMDLAGIEHALGRTIEAVIGLDLLSRRNFTLDYRRKRLLFDTAAKGEGVIPFETRQAAGGTYIVIPLESGDENLQVLVDTGTKDLMLFERGIRGALQNLRVRGLDVNLTVGGHDRVAQIEIPEFKVGPFVRRKQKVYVCATPDDELQSFDGVLGPAAFGARVVTFDFVRHVLSFEAAE